MNKATMSHQRESQVSESVPQSCQLAHGEPDQDEVLEEGIFSLVQGKGPDSQAEWLCVRMQAMPAM